MPKILINEKDRTSPGADGSYANYAVLVAGFCERDPITPAEAERFNITYAAEIEAKTKTPLKADNIQPDANGVYEFDSAQDFIDTIGLMAPTIDSIGNKHYGNQVAYELLKMGYPIVYKPIINLFTPAGNTDSSAFGLNDENFWEIFKDKASYDFRFITHGLLESTDMENPQGYATICNQIELVKAAKKALDDIKDNVFELAQEQEANPDFEIEQALNDGYAAKSNMPGFISQSTKATQPYTNFADAETGVEADLRDLSAEANKHTAGRIDTAYINTVNGHIANLAKYSEVGGNDMNRIDIPGRGDCIALIELDEKKYVTTTSTSKPETLISSAITEMSDITSDTFKGKFCALTVPSVVYKMTDYAQYVDEVDGQTKHLFDNNKKFPGAFHYLACFSNSLKSGFAEWYAAAGYTRGVSGYTIDYTTVKLGEVAINALEPRQSYAGGPKFACNVIANFRGNYYLWGNRTAHNLDEKDLVASHFLNIRQLCTTIKKQLYVACRRFTFDPNSDTLWINFCNAIRPTLETMKADQGIRDYRIVKITDNPKKATLRAKIRIIPIEAVEDFDLEVSLEDSFGETTASVTE